MFAAADMQAGPPGEGDQKRFIITTALLFAKATASFTAFYSLHEVCILVAFVTLSKKSK